MKKSSLGHQRAQLLKRSEKRKRRRLRFEALEDRRMLAASAVSVSVVAGELQIQETSLNLANSISVKVDSANVRVSSTGADMLTPGAGATSNNGDVLVPLDSINTMHVQLLGGDDTLTVDYGGGNFVRPSDSGTIGIQFDGGEDAETAGDQLKLQGGSFTNATFGFNNAGGDLDNGTVLLTGNATLTYTGLEPITSTITSTNVILNFSSADETITVTGSGTTTTVDSTAGETTTFTNPTGKLEINPGGGTNLIKVDSLSANYPADVFLNDGTASDTTQINTSLTLSKRLDIGAETISLNAAAIQTGTHQDYRGDTTLVQATTLSSTGGDTIKFHQTVTGNVDLVVNTTGSTVFGGTVGSPTPLASITTDAGGTTTLGPSMSTQGDGMDFKDDVQLAADTTLSDSGTTGISFAETVSSATTERNLNVETTNASAEIEFSKTVSSVSAVTVTNAGLLDIKAAADFTLSGSFTQNGAGPVDLAGDIVTTNDAISFAKDVDLKADVLLDTDSGAGSITFSDVLDDDGATSNRTLTVDAGTGGVTFTGAVGGNQALQAITINSAKNVTFTSTVATSANLTQNAGSGTTTFNGTSAAIGGQMSVTTDAIKLNSAAMNVVGAVTLDAQNAIELNAGLDAGSSKILIKANQDGIGSSGLKQVSGADISTTSTVADAVVIEVDGTGDADLAKVSAGATGRVDVTASAILDNNAGGTNVDAGSAVLVATGGSVGTSTNALETSFDKLEGSAVGDFYVTNAGGLTLGSVEGTVTGVSAGGDLQVVVSSPLTVAEKVSATGSVILTASDSSSTGDDLTVNTGVTISSSSSSVELNAGDDASLPSGTTLSAATTVTVNIDAGDLDAGAGGTVDFAGDIDATSAEFNGNAQVDTFHIRPDQDAEQTPLTVNGLAPTSVPGDVLNLDITGLTDPTLDIQLGQGNGRWTFSNAESVSYTSIESVATTPSGACFTLRLDMSFAGFDDVGTTDIDHVDVEVLSGTPEQLRVVVDGVEAFRGDLTNGGQPTICAFEFVGSDDQDVLDLSAFSDSLDVVLSGLGTVDGLAGDVDLPTSVPVNPPSTVGLPSSFTNLDGLIGSSGTADALTGPDLRNHWDLGGMVAGLGMTNRLSDTGVLVADESDLSLTGNASVIGRPTGTDPIAPSGGEQDLAWTGFENLVGGSQDDRFDLRAGASLSGNLDGGTQGTQGDSLDYRDFTTSVTVDLDTGSATGINAAAGGGVAAAAGGDVGSSIENVFGGNASDVISGDADNNILGDGHDSDSLVGRTGDDTFRLEPGAVEAGTGASADTVSDVSGQDTVDFRFADAAVTVDMDLLDVPQDVLAAAGAQTVTLMRDTLHSPISPSMFENAVGSQFSDVIDIDPLSTGGDHPQNGPPVVRNVDGNTPHAPASPGDTLKFDAQGSTTTDTGFSITAAGIGTVTYQSIENLVAFDQATRILDDGDVGFSYTPNVVDIAVRDWTRFTSAGFGGDYVASASQTPLATATWQFHGLQPGTYQVAATWAVLPNGAVDAPFDVKDDDTSLGMIAVDQSLAPNDFTDAGVGWETLGTFTISSHTLTVELTDDIANFSQRVVADAIRLEPVGAGGELVVELANEALADDQDRTSLATELNVAASQTYTLRNIGSSSLTIDGIFLSAASSAQLSLTTPATPFSIAAGGSSTFQLNLGASDHGEFNGQIQILSDDVNENVVQMVGATGIDPLMTGNDVNPFTVDVTGTVRAQSIIDNSSAGGFATSGTWTLSNESDAFNGSRLSNTADGSGDTATWTFTNLPAGDYRVSATWDGDVSATSTAKFTIDDGTTTTDVTVNQQIASNDFTADGADWEDLGGTGSVGSVPVYTLAADGSLTVTLSDDGASAQYVIADAVRIERIQEPVASLSVNPPVADDTGVVDFGTTRPYTPVMKTFTITNNSSAAGLTVSEPIQLPAGFTLTNVFGVAPDGTQTTTIAPAGTATFVVRMDAGALGHLEGEIAVPTNDPYRSLYNFQVTGTVANPSHIIDDGDAGYSAPGFNVRPANGSSGGGFAGDYSDSNSNAGNTATWSFDLGALGLPTGGTYRVSASWVSIWDRADNAPFTVYDGTVAPGNLVGTAVMDQTQPPNDVFDQGAHFEDLGVFTISSGHIRVTLTDVGANPQRVVADAVRIERLTAPEIEVTDATTGEQVDDGEATIDLGNAPLNGPAVQRSFTITNAGDRALALGTPSLPAGLTLVGNFPTSIAPGGSQVFTLEMDTASAVSIDGDIVFATDDPDENPFNFRLTGQVAAFTTTFLDNSNPGYSTPSGGWIDFSFGSAYDGDIAYTSFDGVDSPAVWTLDQLPAGLYRVSATWQTPANATTNASYSVYDGTTSDLLVGQIDINQRILPNDFMDGGSNWEDLGGFFRINSGRVTVALRDDPTDDGYLFADGVRIQKVMAATPEIEVSVAGTRLDDGSGVIDLGSTSPGVPTASQTVTVANIGTGDLTLGTTLTLPTGFSIVASSPATLFDGASSTIVGAGTSVTFDLQYDGSGAGSVSGSASFTNDDGNENPFDFTVMASVAVPVTIIDDGDPGSTLSSRFIRSTSNGYNGDFHYDYGGYSSFTPDGDVATYTFSGLTPGNMYRVSTTWVNFAGGAMGSDVPHTVAGVTAPGTIDVNQRVAPNDFNEGGRPWEDLGIYTTTGATITVSIGDGSNGLVSADAVRIENLGPLHADLASALPSGPAVNGLTEAELGNVFKQAVDYWSGHTEAGGFSHVQVFVTDLPSTALGAASEITQTIWVDRDAAGIGWQLPGGSAVDPRHRVDLLTTLTHELGHLLGLEHVEEHGAIMSARLSPGRALVTAPLNARDAGRFDRFYSDLSGDLQDMHWTGSRWYDTLLRRLDSEIDLLDGPEEEGLVATHRPHGYDAFEDLRVRLDREEESSLDDFFALLDDEEAEDE